jgi:hypothetical protein
MCLGYLDSILHTLASNIMSMGQPASSDLDRLTRFIMGRRLKIVAVTAFAFLQVAAMILLEAQIQPSPPLQEKRSCTIYEKTCCHTRAFQTPNGGSYEL